MIAMKKLRVHTPEGLEIFAGRQPRRIDNRNAFGQHTEELWSSPHFIRDKYGALIGVVRDCPTQVFDQFFVLKKS